MDLFMDEAGYTGPDLVNRDQPVLVLGSTIACTTFKAALDGLLAAEASAQ